MDSDLQAQKALHFNTRTHAHISRVKRNSMALVAAGVIGDELLAQVESHDDSKYHEPEHSTYVEITWMYRCRRLGEPYELTAELKNAMAQATLHHVMVNKHHPEHWAPTASINVEDRDAPPAELIDGTSMDDVSLAEMCCDWVAMSQEKLETNSAHAWAAANVNVRWKFTNVQIARIYEFLDTLQNVLDRGANQ